MPGKILDIHTHNAGALDAIINVGPGFRMEPGKIYSVGVHPWDTSAHDLDKRMAILETDARRQEAVAIGETGIDKLKGAPDDVQAEVFRRHVALSEELKKPLILHVVKAFPEIIRFKEELKPGQPWIVHGFRGKPELARELIRHGFYISLGERFNPESAVCIPRDRLLAETDESAMAIESIVECIPNLDISLPFTIFGIGNNN